MQEDNNLLFIEFSNEDSVLGSEELDKFVRQQQATRILPFSKTRTLLYTTVLNSEKLTEGDDVKTVYRISLSIKDLPVIEYSPGDTIGILPTNNINKVDKILNRLNLLDKAERIYNLSISKNTKKKNAVIPKHIPSTGRLKDIFLYQVDIHSVPKKMFLKALLNYTTNEIEIERLQLISSPKGSVHYNDFIQGKNGKSLLGLLQEFPSCNPPVEILLEYLPPLQARPYSICSSPLSDSLEITFFVIEEKIGGLCTSYLENLIRNNCELQYRNIAFYFRTTNNFCLPDDSSVPIILIATGTGLSPFRGFLQHRYMEIKKNNNAKSKVGEAYLFFGCRYNTRDNLYKNEINEYLNAGALSMVKYAFSREDKNKKEYVQNKLIECGQELVDVIMKKNGVIYVCGDPKTMMVDVENAFKNMFVKCGCFDEAAATVYLEELKKQNKYITDAWI